MYIRALTHEILPLILTLSKYQFAISHKRASANPPSVRATNFFTKQRVSNLRVQQSRNNFKLIYELRFSKLIKITFTITIAIRMIFSLLRRETA